MMVDVSVKLRFLVLFIHHVIRGFSCFIDVRVGVTFSWDLNTIHII